MVADAVIVQDCTGHNYAAAHARGVLEDPSGPVQASEAGLEDSESPLDDVSGLREALVVVLFLLLPRLTEGSHEPRLEGVTCVP